MPLLTQGLIEEINKWLSRLRVLLRCRSYKILGTLFRSRYGGTALGELPSAASLDPNHRKAHSHLAFANFEDAVKEQRAHIFSRHRGDIRDRMPGRVLLPPLLIRFQDSLYAFVISLTSLPYMCSAPHQEIASQPDTPVHCTPIGPSPQSHSQA